MKQGLMLAHKPSVYRARPVLGRANLAIIVPRKQARKSFLRLKILVSAA
jgi:hypothetical protein